MLLVQVPGNHLEKEPTLTIYLRGAKDSCELNHTCRHSPAVPAAATTLRPLPLPDIAEFELVRC